MIVRREGLPRADPQPPSRRIVTQRRLHRHTCRTRPTSLSTLPLSIPLNLLSFPLPPSITHTPSHSLTRTLSFSLSLSISLSQSLSLSLSPSLPLPLSLTLSVSLNLSHTHALTHTVFAVVWEASCGVGVGDGADHQCDVRFAGDGIQGRVVSMEGEAGTWRGTSVPNPVDSRGWT